MNLGDFGLATRVLELVFSYINSWVLYNTWIRELRSIFVCLWYNVNKSELILYSDSYNHRLRLSPR
jgi:hypothetical protein